jgi:hypothetical protein
VTDRLALAVRVMKARRTSICTICRAPVLIGQSIARLTSPSGWCHLTCVPVVAALQATTTTTGERP